MSGKTTGSGVIGEYAGFLTHCKRCVLPQIPEQGANNSSWNKLLIRSPISLAEIDAVLAIVVPAVPPFTVAVTVSVTLSPSPLVILYHGGRGMAVGDNLDSG